MSETKARGTAASPRARHCAPGEPGALVDGIVSVIRKDGPITFERFMETALYAPGKGYYTSGRDTWGKSGDYITSIDVSAAFARTIARQLCEMWAALGEPASFVLVEAGAGRGWLTKGIEESIGNISPGLSEAIRFVLVEKNPALREPPTEKKSWFSDIGEVPPVQSGCILSNDLIDSFPVHKVVFTEASLKEVYVGHDSGFVETIGPLSNPEIESYFSSVGIEPFEGMETEVNLHAIKWIEKAAGLFEKGFVITIDYGFPARELYAPERKGTLVCHFRHTLNEDPYANIGGQELTGFTTQKNFLLGLGVLEELKAPQGSMPVADEIAHNRAIARLITPGGMGDVFSVLIQHKGIGKPVLSGFSFKDLSKRLS